MFANTGNDILDFVIDNAEYAADQLMDLTEPAPNEAKVTVMMLQQALTALQMEYKKIYTELVDFRMEAQTEK